MNGKKPSLPHLKKPDIAVSKNSVFKMVRILVAIAAILNLFLLFGFNYGLTDLPAVSAEENAGVSSVSETAAASESTVIPDTTAELDTSVETETSTEPETPAESETSTDSESSTESETALETEVPTESETSARMENSKNEKNETDVSNAETANKTTTYEGPVLKLTGEIPAIPASDLKKLPVLLAKQGILTAEDGYGNDIAASVTIRYQMDYRSQGTLKAQCSLTNGKGDSTSLEFTFKPILTEPLMLLSKNKVTLQKGDKFDYLDYISVAMDTNGASLSKVIRLSGSVDTATPGTYEMIYRITGSSGQTSEAKLTVTVA